MRSGIFNIQTIVTYILASLCAGLLAFVLTPLVRVLAFKIGAGAINVPRDGRRMHRVPIPQIGGAAIFIAFALTAISFADLTRLNVAILFGGLLIAVMGLIDDVFGMKAIVKLAIQVLAAFIAVYEGFAIRFVPFGSHTVVLGAWSIPLTVIWIVGLTNSINLIDGLDGLACGISVTSSLSLFVVMLLLGDTSSALLVAIIIGACLGFLPFNAHPAKIFMGDTGSQTLGYLLSLISINGVFKTHTVISFLIPIAIFGLPLFDTFFAIVRRIAHGKSPFSPDRGHIHHKLIDMGFGQKKSVRILYSVCGLLNISAVLLTLERYTSAAIIFIAGLILFAVSIIVYKNPKIRAFTGMFDEIDAMETGIKIATENDISNKVKDLALTADAKAPSEPPAEENDTNKE